MHTYMYRLTRRKIHYFIIKRYFYFLTQNNSKDLKLGQYLMQLKIDKVCLTDGLQRSMKETEN